MFKKYENNLVARSKFGSKMILIEINSYIFYLVQYHLLIFFKYKENTIKAKIQNSKALGGQSHKSKNLASTYSLLQGVQNLELDWGLILEQKANMQET